jgi:hypothetical protein
MGKGEVDTKAEKEKFWQEHIDGWRSSGLSQQAYCRNNHLAMSTFGYWRRKLKVQMDKSDKPRFYPLALAGPPQTGRLSQGGGCTIVWRLLESGSVSKSMTNFLRPHCSD